MARGIPARQWRGSDSAYVDEQENYISFFYQPKYKPANIGSRERHQMNYGSSA
jgi:hypothetical protein